MEQLKAAYANYWWARLAVCASLLICGILLYAISGGFPPWAWRFSLTVYPQTGRLWQMQGPAILFPLVGLGLLSLSLLILWTVLLVGIIKVILYWWQDFHARRHFALELQEAEQLAEQMAQREREEHERMQQLAAAWQPHDIALARASARASRRRATGQLVASAASSSVPDRASVVPAARGAPVRTRPIVSAAPAASSSASVGSGKALPVAASANGTAPIAAPRPQVEPSKPPEPAALVPLVGVRNKLRIVPRIEEEAEDENYDTQPSLELMNSDDIEQHHTLPPPEASYEEESEPQKEALRLIVGIGLDPGIVRKDSPNEDNLLAVQGMYTGDEGAEPVGLFVVADGMGGHADGQEASRLAIQAISNVVAPALLHKADVDETFADLLKDGAHRANLAIYQRNRQQGEMMGTTLTAALIVGTVAYVVNVGDSRTYLYRPAEGLQQITRDHSHVAQLVERGEISREEIYTHPRRNQIYRCLGEKAALELDSFEVALQVGDILLLCSDGLWEMVRDPDIERVIASSAPHASQISSMLVQAALTRGGADNISVVVVCMLPTKD